MRIWLLAGLLFLDCFGSLSGQSVEQMVKAAFQPVIEFNASPVIRPDDRFFTKGRFSADGNPQNSQFIEEPSRTQYMGSAYVPIDSWVYPVIERLAALHYVQTASLTIRPWTRMQCARLTKEVEEALKEDQANSIERGARAGDLEREFAPELALLESGRNLGASAETAYSRIIAIGGSPLRDSKHFSQTLTDDFGRPYGKGFNAVSGISGRAELGPFAFYLRGEYQRAPGSPAYSLDVQHAVGIEDVLPLGAGPFFPFVDRARPIEAYMALNLHDWQVTFGQQSLWWGPGRSTSLLMTNNAEAMPMLRVDRSAPLTLPWVFRWIGPIRFTALLARAGGAHYVRLGPDFVLTGSSDRSLNPQPFVWGTQISFQPTQNLEFGLGLTTVFAGYGRPLTFGTFFHTLSQNGNIQAVDPGDRRTELNFTYRLPGLRNWVALYAEGLAEDESLPLLFPRRSAMAPGLYFPQLPGASKLDLRAEAVYTNLPNLKPQNFFYNNSHYANGYTNYGQTIGSWVGPQGIGWQATSTYWVGPRKTVSATYRRLYTDQGLLEGGNGNDFAAKASWLVKPTVQVSGGIQYERQNFRILAPGPKTDVSSSIEVVFTPKISR